MKRTALKRKTQLKRTPMKRHKEIECEADNCCNTFIPFNSMQAWCSPKCGYQVSQQRTRGTKEYNRHTKVLKNKAKKSDKKLLKERATEYCNRYIKLRDRNEPCISCGEHKPWDQWNAGHYRNKGSSDALRYDERNINLECVSCNLYDDKHLLRYKVNLINKIGLAAVEELDNDRRVSDWTAETLQAVIDDYKARIIALGFKPSREVGEELRYG